MDGIHDMGGMRNFGPVVPEPDEPLFHAGWERRTFGLNMVMLAYVGPIDRARHAIERMDPAEYLNTTYYEHWLYAVEQLSQELGYITAEELRSGEADGMAELPHPPPDAAMAEGLARGGMPATRDVDVAPAFAAGDRVVARNLEVTGHTRLARYVRGKRGTVIAFRGCHAFPDSAAHDLGENPHPLYTVRFEARDLWGENVTRRDCVQIDLWEAYLRPAGETK